MKNDNFADEEYDYMPRISQPGVKSETVFVLLLAVIKIMNLL